ncbi:MAG: hypothetical protein GC171_15625 [Terrimonas sp.]|nr:hypothetical protein [Terrimonas sp.]
MENLNRDLLVLLRTEFMNPDELEQEVSCINDILHYAESPENFCTAHELVVRTKITQKPRKILKAIRQVELAPFYFLINKN